MDSKKQTRGAIGLFLSLLSRWPGRRLWGLFGAKSLGVFLYFKTDSMVMMSKGTAIALLPLRTLRHLAKSEKP